MAERLHASAAGAVGTVVCAYSAAVHEGALTAAVTAEAVSAAAAAAVLLVAVAAVDRPCCSWCAAAVACCISAVNVMLQELLY
jgi:hypothetical protein